MEPYSHPHNSGLKFSLLRKMALFSRWAFNHRIRGVNRLLKMIYDPNKRQGDYFDIVMEYDSQLLIHINTSSLIEWILFFYGSFESEIDKMIKRLLQSGGVAMDVGANIGCHTLIMAAQVGPRGKVVAFEPCPDIFGRLQDNIFLNNFNNVILLPWALSNISGELPLHLPRRDVFNRGTASLYFSDDWHGENKVLVPVKTIDEVVADEKLERLDLLKIDTEGNELKVMMGGEDSIKEYRPYIIFEYSINGWESSGYVLDNGYELLTRLNYSLYVIRRGYLTKMEYGVPQETNILAVPRR
jgi:FkbM family methyltransferase